MYLIFSQLSCLFIPQLTCAGSQGWLLDRNCLSLSSDCSLGIRAATTPSRRRRSSRGLGGTTSKALSCCSSPLPSAWLASVTASVAGAAALAVAGGVAWEVLDATRLGRVCFLCRVMPELPLGLACTVSSLTCSSCNVNNDCENSSNDNNDNKK